MILPSNDGSLGGAPICPGETVELPLEFALAPGATTTSATVRLDDPSLQ